MAKHFSSLARRSVELRVILSGLVKSCCWAGPARQRRLSQYLGQYFLDRGIEDWAQSLCFPWLWLSPVCRVGLAYSSVFLWSFFIKITFNKENVLETASVMHRDFVGWEKASFLVSSGLPGPFLVTPECAKDWWQSSRYPSPLRSEDSSTLWRICSNWATGTFVISLSDFSEHNGCGMTWSAAALAWLGHETPGRSE